MVPRRDAEPLLEPLALPLSAGGVPLRATRRRERGAREARPRVRADGHRHLRRRPLLDRRGALCEGRPVRRPPHRQVTNAGPDEDTLHVLPTAWYRNTWAWEVGPTAPVLRAAGDAADRDGASLPRRARARRGRRARRRARPSFSSATTRRTTSGCSGRPALRVPEGRHRRPRGPRRRDREPRATGTKAAFRYRVTVAPGETVELGCACGRRGADVGLGRISTRSSRPAGPRQTSSTQG